MSIPATKKLMDYLARRDHSEKELREKLGKNFSPCEVEAAIVYADENNWLPDPRELSERVALRLHEKKKGFLYIQQYLREKGLPSVDRSEEIEIQKGLAVLDMAGSEIWSYEQKVRKLKNRGFDHEAIQSVIRTSRDE